MQPRRFEMPKLVSLTDGRATIDPGNWQADDRTRATVTLVSVRKVVPGQPIANWPVVHGTTVVPPNGESPAQAQSRVGYYAGSPFTLPQLGPDSYRLELWRGNVYPGVIEWGHEASDFGPSNAILEFTLEGSTPPPPPPVTPSAQVTRANMTNAAKQWEAGRPQPLARITTAKDILELPDSRWYTVREGIRAILDDPGDPA